MVKIIDPAFLLAIEKLKEDKPQNYIVKEINLYNNGKDALQQQIIITGNVLQVLDFPEFCDIKIQFNEPTNEAITLKKGIFLFNFYQFFLTYEHTEIPEPPVTIPRLLKLLIGKDLISVQEPTSVEKASLELVPVEQMQIPGGTGNYVLPCKYAYPSGQTYFCRAFNVGKYNQIRGIASKYCYLGGTHYLYVNQFITGGEKHQTKIEIPNNTDVSFIIDLVTPRIQFSADKDPRGITWDIFLYAKAWAM